MSCQSGCGESIDFCMLDYPCSYLPEMKTRMYYRYMRHASKSLAGELVRRGWRRFGCYFFHPICAGCNGCKSLRIDVEGFRLSRSQKRVMKKNRSTMLYVRKPGMTREHIDLYNRFHKYKSETSDWKYTPITPQLYYENFVDGAHDYGKEVLYFIDDKLVGVDLIDLTDDGISSVYFYYDPDYGRYSLGVYSLLMQIHFARQMGLRWIYLGYWVEGCKSFAYKTNYRPLEILEGFPPLEEEPRWEPWLTSCPALTLFDEPKPSPKSVTITQKGGTMPTTPLEIAVVEELLHRWDPIGLFDDPAIPRDEYDLYAPPIARMVATGCDEEALFERLKSIRVDMMLLEADDAWDRAIAKKILESLHKERP